MAVLNLPHVTPPSAVATLTAKHRRVDTGLDTYDASLALGHGEDVRSYLVAA